MSIPQTESGKAFEYAIAKAIEKITKASLLNNSALNVAAMAYNKHSESIMLVSFAGGWQISFRIHNASSRVEPSLKFDVQFVGLPQDVARHEITLQAV